MLKINNDYEISKDFDHAGIVSYNQNNGTSVLVNNGIVIKVINSKYAYSEAVKYYCENFKKDHLLYRQKLTVKYWNKYNDINYLDEYSKPYLHYLSNGYNKKVDLNYNKIQRSNDFGYNGVPAIELHTVGYHDGKDYIYMFPEFLITKDLIKI